MEGHKSMFMGSRNGNDTLNEIFLISDNQKGLIPISFSAKRISVKQGNNERYVHTVIAISEISWNLYTGQTNKRTLKKIHSKQRRYIVNRS